MAKVKIKMARDCFVDGQLYESKKEYSVDEKTGAYLMRIGRAVPAGAQTKKTTTKAASDE